GIEIGLERGREAERLIALQQLRDRTQRQLSRKLGTLPEKLSAQINQLSIDSLDQLGDVLLEFERAEDLENWLRNLVMDKP
ncbi:MAG: DUF4351 domain-containing protein, partial [Cyanobacteria bacterium J06560_2]